jgi:putative DNA methylase
MTIPKECKRLAEVDFPIAEVSKHAAREKSIRHGHPSTLHLWWARRPLASSRAVLMALLLPDPLDPLCPDDFKTQAREILSQVQNVGKADAGLRAALLKFIGDFSNWDLASNSQYLSVGRGLVKAAHPDETPLVVDPFAGGGSIPLEALRLGCDSFASDLNPVAGLIQKVMLEDIPRYGHQKIKVQTEQGEVEADGLAAALRLVGAEIKTAAEKELAEFYPPDPDGSHPIAYLWARTVRCESPNCGAEIPLVRSFWLSKKANRRYALRPNVIRDVGKTPRVEFQVFTPKDESDVDIGTVHRANATCLCCGATLPASRVRVQLSTERGGADIVFDEQSARSDGAYLLAVISTRAGISGRHYRIPTQKDFQAISIAQKNLAQMSIRASANGLSLIPDEPTPKGGGSGAARAFSVQKYGMMNFGDLFNSRQKLTLVIYQKLISRYRSNQLSTLFAFAFNRVAMSDMSCTRWNAVAEKMQHTFGRQALPIVWDYAEVVPIAEAPGNWQSGYELIADIIEKIPQLVVGQAQLADAMESPLTSESVSVWFTDPPYYDAVPYAELSDFFLVWLKRNLPNQPILNDPFDPENRLSQKSREIVQDETKQFAGKPKDQAFFEEAMAKAFTEGRRLLREDGIGSVVFAHKTTEGWESLLSGMIRGGWVITGSWPIATELKTRLRAQDAAALATSVHLICRPRPEVADIGDWTQVSRELPRKVSEWMQRLQGEGVRGADLVFACIGPALEIYSRYFKVVDAEDREIPLGGDPEARLPHLRGYLAYVWETVGRLALEQVLGTSDAQKDATNALEEDARLTALFLWTQGSASPQSEKPNGKLAEVDEEPESDDDEETLKIKSKSGYSLPFDVVRRFAQPLGIHLPEWENRIIDTDKGVVTLLSVKDRAQQLFGEDGASAFASEIEDNPIKSMQMSLFADAESAMKVRGRRKAKKDGDMSFNEKREATTLDRLHAAMLLQKGGQTTALRALLQSESERGSDFMRLANALTALYPRESEEKRLLDALLVNVRR